MKRILKIKECFSFNEAEKTQNTPRYFVYNPLHEGKPKKVYDSYQEALKDAQDVASKYDRCNVYVLEIKSEIERKQYTNEIIKENGEITEEKSWETIPF